jgi:hypothetical protein
MGMTWLSSVAAVLTRFVFGAPAGEVLVPVAGKLCLPVEPVELKRAALVEPAIAELTYSRNPRANSQR